MGNRKISVKTANHPPRKMLAGLFSLMLSIGFVFSAQAQERLRLATTTSVQDTGLMPYLMPHFEKLCGCKVDVIAVGSGQALRLASNGDVDMVIVHSPDAEAKFVNDGFGINRKTLMVNDFVILGPSSDPARIRGMKHAARALSSIQKTKSSFISRGDSSGTYQKEMSLWKKASIKPEGSWYFEIGQGMGAALTVADEKQAYTISDRATYLARMDQLRLRILLEGDPELTNPYSAIQVNPSRHPSVKSGLSRQLIEWLCSSEGQDLIGGYRVDGHDLFKPACADGEATP
jgi:tungstate transport system substrate-binding protein